MRKLYFTLLLAVALVGCGDIYEQDKITSTINRSYSYLVASIDNSSTRVYIEDDLSLSWHEGDSISVFYANDFNNIFAFNGKSGDKSGSFSLSGNGGEGSASLDRIYAIYPYQTTATISAAGTISLLVPSKQSYAERSFPRDGNIMVAATSGEDDVILAFRNAVGYLKLKLWGEGTVKSIKVEGNADEKISGAAELTASTSGAPTLTMGANATTSITLDCGTGVELSSSKSTPTEFWIAMPETTFSSGICITVTDTEKGVFSKKTSNKVVIERNYIKPMAALQVQFEATTPKNNEIWYTTTNGEALSLSDSNFGATITSNQKQGDKWVVTFDKDLTMLGVDGSFKGAFDSQKTLQSVVLPNSITKIGAYAFYNCSALESATLPSNLETIGAQAFYATKLSDVTIPANVTSIDNKAFGNTNIQSVYVLATTPPSLTNTEVFPSTSIPVYVPEESIKEYESHAVWCYFFIKALPEDMLGDNTSSEGDGDNTGSEGEGDNTGNEGGEGEGGEGEGGEGEGGEGEGGEGEDGNEGETPGGSDPVIPPAGGIEISYTTSDGNAITFNAQCFDASIVSHEKQGDKWVVTFSGAVTSLKNAGVYGAFEGNTTLTSITLPDSLVSIADYSFYGCTALSSVTLPVSLSTIGAAAFCECSSLTSITLPENVTSIGDGAFVDCNSLSTVYSMAVTPPSLGSDAFKAPYASREDKYIYVPEASYSDYYNTWAQYKDNIVGEPYESTDFSADGEVVMLQSATVGNGIDIVLMGDGYSDRHIANGRYEQDMRRAMEHFFSEEPFTSFRNMFNVYMVKCVSKLEGCNDSYAYGSTALNCKVKSDGISIDGDSWVAYGYTGDIVGESRLDEALTIVIMNSNVHAGICYMQEPTVNTTGNYGNGRSLSYFPLCGDDDAFRKLILHEACGHGFAKLGDEYSYSGNGHISEGGYYDIKYFEQWGWYKNIDCVLEGSTLDATTIKWKHLLTDSRYQNDGLGVFEGAYTYATGAYRPTDDSLMNHRNGGFNAPSREAIYIRIHKLAYGDSWTYNYEEFVAYDAKNRS